MKQIKEIINFFIPIIIGICFLIYIVYSSSSDRLKEHVQPLSYYFQITKKNKGKFLEFEGYDENHYPVKFCEGEFWDIYNSVEIGDTLLKKKGETNLILIKKDTTLIFPLLWDGKQME